MVVVVILGILTALAAPRVIDYIVDARIQAAKTDITTLESAVSYYRLDNYDYPPVEFGLNALVEQLPELEIASSASPPRKDDGLIFT